ncbi:MAG: glycosyltransferase family 2 protein, partial [Anaerolineae bacterium]|nr:glycosyltransferase family 2 protein [Anaerolineae bacterium]
MKLSVVIPCYNEVDTIEKVLDRVLSVGLADEVVIVDDGSSDGTRDVLHQMQDEGREGVRIIFHEQNKGKGAALVTGFAAAAGDILLIQDADLEYDPNDYQRLLQPILSGDADVVYGSRFANSTHRRVLFFWHTLGNKFLTLLSNILTDLNLTDMETCYKMARASILKSIPIRSNRFGIEPEITAKLAKR